MNRNHCSAALLRNRPFRNALFSWSHCGAAVDDHGLVGALGHDFGAADAAGGYDDGVFAVAAAVASVLVIVSRIPAGCIDEHV